MSQQRAFGDVPVGAAHRHLVDGAYRDENAVSRFGIHVYREFRIASTTPPGNVVIDDSGAPRGDAHQRTYAIPAPTLRAMSPRAAEGQNSSSAHAADR